MQLPAVRRFSSAWLLLLLIALVATTTLGRNVGVLSFSMMTTPFRSSFSVSPVSSSSLRSTKTATPEVDAGVSRRLWIKTVTTATVAATGSLLTVSPSLAASSSSFQTYTDEKYGFKIDLPSNWSKMNDVTALSDRRSIVVYSNPNEPSTSLLIVYTPIRDDYTSLASFGSVDQVAVQTILPKGNLLNEDNSITAKMLSATSAKQSYIFDYLQQVPEVQQPLTHYRTIFTMGTKSSESNSAGAMLITITLQTPESRYDSKEQSIFDSMINSYTRI